MTRLLVTGASGLLGWNVVREASRDLDVIAVTHRSQIALDGVDVVRADLTDHEVVNELIRERQPDWIIHCAADTSIDALESNPERAFRLNTQMARDVAKAAARVKASMLFVSTDSVFQGSGGPYDESDQPNPLNVYAHSKLQGEQAVHEELPGSLIVRTNLFGWSPGSKRSLAEWFYARLADGRECPGFTDIYFSPVYAVELARIFLRMLHGGLHGLYHVAGADCISKYAFGVSLALTFGFDPELVRREDSAGMNWDAKRPKRTCLSGKKITADLKIDLPGIHDGLAHLRADKENGLFEVSENPMRREGRDA